MAIEKVKLSDLSDETEVAFEDSTYTLTVAELKEEIKEDEEVAERTWYVATPQTWHPDARNMLENYLDNEHQEMYEDWDERALECVTNDVVDKIQAILDEAFKSPSVKNYWTLDKEIEI